MFITHLKLLFFPFLLPSKCLSSRSKFVKGLVFKKLDWRCVSCGVEVGNFLVNYVDIVTSKRWRFEHSSFISTNTISIPKQMWENTRKSGYLEVMQIFYRRKYLHVTWVKRMWKFLDVLWVNVGKQWPTHIDLQHVCLDFCRKQTFFHREQIWSKCILDLFICGGIKYEENVK